MTVFVYVSRRTNIGSYQRRQARDRYQPSPPQPSNLIVKRWPKRWVRRRPLAQGLTRRPWRQRYQPNPPQPSNLVVKRWPKRWVRRRPLAQGLTRRPWRQRYVTSPTPVGFIAARRPIRLRLHSRPLARFFRPRARGIFGVTQLLFAPRRRLRLKRRPRFVARKPYPVQAAPASFVPAKRMWRVRIKRRRLPMPRHINIFFTSLFFFQKPKRPKIFRKRKFTLLPPRLKYPTMAAPAGFVPTRRMWRVRIRRRRSAVIRHPAAFITLLFFFQKPKRPKILRKRKFTLLPPRRKYPTMAAPVSFYPWKKFKAPKLTRKRWSVKKIVKNYYVVPGSAVVKAVSEWLIRARRRGRR